MSEDTEEELDEYLYECDLCHELFDLEQIRVDKDGKHIYCDKCI